MGAVTAQVARFISISQLCYCVESAKFAIGCQTINWVILGEDMNLGDMAEVTASTLSPFVRIPPALS
jgi:hypothetical protein